MRIFKDIFIGDELFSDTYPIEELYSGQILKVKGKFTSEKTDMSAINIGANASEEAPAEDGGEDAGKSGIDIVLANRLAEIEQSKSDLKKYLLTYMGELVKKLEAKEYKEMASFKKECQRFVVEVLKEFKEYQFFMGESMQDGGMVALLRWDGETPYMYFFKQGLEIEKV